jgi:hypothetical protein
MIASASRPPAQPTPPAIMVHESSSENRLSSLQDTQGVFLRILV